MSENFRGEKNFSLDKKNNAHQKLQSYIDNANRRLIEVDRVAAQKLQKKDLSQEVVLRKLQKVNPEKLLKILPGQVADYIEALQREKTAKTDLQAVQEESWKNIEKEMDALSDVYVAKADSRENKELYQACIAFLNEKKGWSLCQKFRKLAPESRLLLDPKEAWTESVHLAQKPQDISGFFPVYRRVIRLDSFGYLEAVDIKYVPIALKETLREFLENEKAQDSREKIDSILDISANGLILGIDRDNQGDHSYYYILPN